MKTHEYFTGTNAAENYVLGNLSGKDKDPFEEHLLLCDICAQEVKKLRDARDLLEESVLIPEMDISLPKHRSNEINKDIGFYLKIAAGVAILAALSWFVIWYFNVNLQNEKLIAGNKEIREVEKVLSIKTDTLTTKKIIANNTSNENYGQLERLESQINEEYRSETVTEVIPSNNNIFKTSDIIEFDWKKQFKGTLTLTIYNNKGKIISQDSMEKDSFSKKIKTPGLYYWQLETDKDIVYTGKFLVK